MADLVPVVGSVHKCVGVCHCELYFSNEGTET
jgi:hypothetical protein